MIVAPLLLRFHHPAKTDRVRFGHRGAFDQNAICVSEILLRGRSSAPAEGGAQTGHRAAMSYPGLVGHTDHAQASSEKLFDEIIFFVIQRRAAEMTYRSRVIDGQRRLARAQTCACAIPKHARPPCPSPARVESPSTLSSAARDISFSFRAANA